MTSHRIVHAAAVGLATLCLTLPALSASASPLKVDPGKSTVTIVFKQLNVPVEASFKKFNAQIDFDGAKPETAKAAVEMDIASFDLGDAQYNQEVMKKDWFNAAQFPKATFTAATIKSAGPGKFTVAGKLSIKGKTSDVSFPLTVKKDGAAQVFDGTLPIKRLTYNIGEGDWKDTDTVADEVLIKFHVVATP
ncbi:MAG: YceI family protein [Herbaspirillum sp.]|jgi:polyisoprenoid-binding protein YceI|nr:YceI family protein [Herbaspirillum sp.]